MQKEIEFLLRDFYNTLPNGSTLIGLYFSRDAKAESYYSIDNNYKVVSADIKDCYNGYYYSGYILGDSCIDRALENNSLYALPIPDVDYSKKLNKAVFLDRDGILMKDEGYVGSIDRVFIVNDFIEFVEKAKERNYLTLVTTNQAGVAYGYYTERDVDNVHKYLADKYREHGAIIDDFSYCPYNTKGERKEYIKDSILRKPHPAMHLEFAKKYNIDMTNSFMVGDRDTDIINLPYLKTYLIETPVYSIKNRDKIVNIKTISQKLL